MLKIQLSDLHWIKREQDDPDDQCAHGAIDISVDGVSLIPRDSASRTKNVSVSAAGLYLLRTVFADHIEGNRVTDDHQPLLPCCGYAVHADSDGEDRVYILGCPYGTDLAVRHDGDEVVLGENAAAVRVSRGAWQQAVLNFVYQVEAFYAAHSPKETPEDPDWAEGWAAFWREWAAVKQRCVADRL